MGREEQVEEREVLDSIFPEEITGTVMPMTTARTSYDRHSVLTNTHQISPTQSTG